MALDGEREALILLPRGNGKTCLQALVALHHLLTVDGAEVFCCASSRDEARILFQYAERFAREIDHPNVIHRHFRTAVLPRPGRAEGVHPVPARPTGRSAAAVRADPDADVLGPTFKERIAPELRVVREGKVRLYPVAELEPWADERAERVIDDVD